MKQRSVKGYGWQKSLPDNRDYYFKVTAPVPLPSSVDLRDQCPPVYDQGALGACSSHAIGAAYQFGLMKQGKSVFMPSRLFLYYNERFIENTVNYDSGAQMKDGLKSLNKDGICDENLWKYKICKYKKKPPQKAYDAAKLNTIELYEKIPDGNLFLMKQCLAKGVPFVFGFTVYESFEGEEIAKTGIMPEWNPNESIMGGHAVMSVGYDTEKQVMIVRNSWGSDWGDCFSGDTKIPLLNGNSVSIEDLYNQGKEIWVYSYCHETGKIVPARATPKFSGIKHDLLSITLDNDEEIITTSNHLFMLRNGSYVKSEELEVGSSLMPLYRSYKVRKNKSEYEKIYQPLNNTITSTHKLVVDALLMKKDILEHVKTCNGCWEIIHHIDFNGLNNNPDNLRLMWHCQHVKLHKELGLKNGKLLKEWYINLTEEEKEMKRKKSIKCIMEYNEKIKSGELEYSDKTIQARRDNMKRIGSRTYNYELTEEIIKVRKNNGRKAGLLPKNENQRNSARKLMHNKWHDKKIPVDKCEKCIAKAKQLLNHKVKSIKKLNISLPMYDLSVEKYHNFALDAGVFVHNCGYFYMPYSYISNPNLASDFWCINAV
jgi:hypothetical protein